MKNWGSFWHKLTQLKCTQDYKYYVKEGITTTINFKNQFQLTITIHKLDPRQPILWHKVLSNISLDHWRKQTLLDIAFITKILHCVIIPTRQTRIMAFPLTWVSQGLTNKSPNMLLSKNRGGLILFVHKFLHPMATPQVVRDVWTRPAVIVIAPDLLLLQVQ